MTVTLESALKPMGWPRLNQLGTLRCLQRLSKTTSDQEMQHESLSPDSIVDMTIYLSGTLRGVRPVYRRSQTTVGRLVNRLLRTGHGDQVAVKPSCLAGIGRLLNDDSVATHGSCQSIHTSEAEQLLLRLNQAMGVKRIDRATPPVVRSTPNALRRGVEPNGAFGLATI